MGPNPSVVISFLIFIARGSVAEPRLSYKRADASKQLVGLMCYLIRLYSTLKWLYICTWYGSEYVYLCNYATKEFRFCESPVAMTA